MPINPATIDLDALVGKHIRDFCDNGFTADNINHCAHFVSHVMELDFSYHCREHTGGSAFGANIRVHEVFAQCPLVGHWDDADTNRTLLIFVTRATHVDLGRKEMVNHPQKHIGIVRGGMVYHYSNSRNRVVKQDVASFFDVFKQVYSGTQGLFFGLVPGTDLDLTIDPDANHVPRGRAFALKRDGNDYTAETDGTPSFYVGTPVRYHGRRGLFHPASRYHGPIYRAADYHARYDHWAHVVEAIGHCETGNHFNLINTYDRAAFTFGFMQMAAHTPNDNLILFFRDLLRLPEAAAYFPELELRNGRVFRINEDGSATDLEAPIDGELRLFMRYLNPGDTSIELQEQLHAARLIHGANTSAAMREVQVKHAVERTAHKVVRRYHPWYNLDGQSDLVVTLIADIHHQGRASKATVAAALATPNPVAALLRVNHGQWSDRNERLEQITQQMVANGTLGTKVYDPATNLFVDPLAGDDVLDVAVTGLPPRPLDPLPLRPPKPPSALRFT